MNSSQIIATYEAILAISGQMLIAARNTDWDRLVALEQDCRKRVEKLIAENAGQSLGGHDQQRKVEIIRGVLADDAEIRSITEPWMAELQTILSNAGRERRLHQTYDPGGGA